MLEQNEPIKNLGKKSFYPWLTGAVLLVLVGSVIFLLHLGIWNPGWNPFINNKTENTTEAFKKESAEEVEQEGEATQLTEGRRLFANDRMLVDIPENWHVQDIGYPVFRAVEIAHPSILENTEEWSWEDTFSIPQDSDYLGIASHSNYINPWTEESMYVSFNEYIERFGSQNVIGEPEKVEVGGLRGVKQTEQTDPGAEAVYYLLDSLDLDYGYDDLLNSSEAEVDYGIRIFKIRYDLNSPFASEYKNIIDNIVFNPTKKQRLEVEIMPAGGY